ncbi:hypothetical protein HF289_16615 [Acidithiobacillus ferrooxidans]|uniref:hypothetical protein n=1 Tax=Acidithiobacillus ferrooxidans TaxID=920 RepID=UPI001C06661D|nr:hypothetical protein [Acidithiobacillus ferrooxidans]MBU2858406.1 hypothetical protein [Acidithiobacillus ferrooxidans]MCR2830698.1 hypothetical protein [Acidithiobacillus ferrooxidans]
MAVLSQQMIREIDARRMARSREAARVWMVRIIFVLYWLLIFTGALRKWGFPQLQKPLFFIAVPFTVWLYGISLMKNRWPRGFALLNFAYLLAGAAVLLIPVQMIIGHYALRYGIIAGYGWLNYFFYIPLTFIIAKEFKQDDVLRLLRHTLWIGIASAPLVALQFMLPPGSVINAGNAANTADQFNDLGSALGHIRPGGFFSSSIGLQMFLATLAIAILYGWIESSQNIVARKPTLAFATMALLSMLAFSGSRGAMLQVALVFAATSVAGIISHRRKLAIRTGVWPMLTVLVLVIFWPVVFPEAYDTFITRWNEAAAVSPFVGGIFGRALYPLYAWVYYLHTPFIGYLLGLGTNAAARLHWVHEPAAAYAWTGYGIWGRESGFAVHLVELGLVLGAGYIFFRIWFTLWLLIKVWKSTVRNHNPLALMLFSFAGELVLMGQITVQGTVNGYTWIFLGVTLAAAKFSPVKNGDTSSPVRLER